VRDVWSIDPRSGQRVRLVCESTSTAEVGEAARAAGRAAGELGRRGRPARALVLRRAAGALEERADRLIGAADRETALGKSRLTAELARTSSQLRLLADVAEDGAYQEAIVTPAQADVDPPVPELRRILIPVGPVLVFAAGNFPFAFSVLGGDTASALAAGCPVVVKCHPGHPETSLLAMEAWRQAAADAGFPGDAVQLVFGDSAGRQLVQDPGIRAVSFTGSLAVGRELHDLAAARPDPVPFYGELSGVNPFVVTAGAARERAEEIGRGVAASFMLNGGQFCTKPGLLFVPAGPDGDRLLGAAATAVAASAQFVMLSAKTRRDYLAGQQMLLSHPGVTTVAQTAGPEEADSYQGGFLAGAALLEIAIGELNGQVVRECFGPLAVAIRYSDIADVISQLSGLQGALAAAVHGTEPEAGIVAAVTEAVTPKVGRIVYDGYPTGVAVTSAMTHGGPWPATTNALHSSVGSTALRRFLRPVTYQNAPQAILPADLRDTAGVLQAC
jgi:NADP-dependent aldehyde dehydrogenase